MFKNLLRAAEDFLAEAASGLTWVERCVEQARWGEAHAVAVTSTHLALCGCLAVYGRLPATTDEVERMFFEHFNGHALGVGPQLSRMERLRETLDDTPWRPFTAEEWIETHQSMLSILAVVVTLLPRESLGRARIETARRALAQPRLRGPRPAEITSLYW